MLPLTNCVGKAILKTEKALSTMVSSLPVQSKRLTA